MFALKYSNIKRYIYKEKCQSLGEKIHAPVLDVDTRWNSTYLMLFQAVKMRKVGLKYCLEMQYSSHICHVSYSFGQSL